jgi:GntR family transcriptional regulator
MELKIDHSSLIPLHAQVEELLRELIDLPEYQNGALLPGEVDMSKRLGISRNTLRQAINKLVNEGLLVRKKGVGTKVAERGVLTHLENWHSFTQEMDEKGISLKNYEIHVSKVMTDGKIADFFGISHNEMVVKLTRLRGDDDGPFVYFESFFHPRVGLTGSEDFSQPLYDLLESQFSTIPVRSREILSAKPASYNIAEKLRITAQTPILVRERYVYDPGDRPVEYNIGFYRADKFSYSVNIRR